jgi:hypothetical protein
MRASEWQFLCAVHDAPKSCCAIDYCCHTLDWAANVVTNPKLFPSRFVGLADSAHDRGAAALKSLVNVFRRLHRIFAHAWFQHRGVFWCVEGQTGLYVFFKTVCDLYDLLPAENYKLPPEAEGLETAGLSQNGGSADSGSDGHQQQNPALVVTGIARPPRSDSDEESFNPVGRTNTRRHIRSSPSTGNAVTTVPEVDEGDDAASVTSVVTSKLGEMHISAPHDAVEDDDDPDVTEVPVIVMDDIIPHRFGATGVDVDQANGASQLHHSPESGDKPSEEPEQSKAAEADSTGDKKSDDDAKIEDAKEDEVTEDDEKDPGDETLLQTPTEAEHTSEKKTDEAPEPTTSSDEMESLPSQEAATDSTRHVEETETDDKEEKPTDSDGAEPAKASDEEDKTT